MHGSAKANFYPRPPRGGRLENNAAMNYNSAISIHALREEGDCLCRRAHLVIFVFLSTPSARRATSSSPVVSPFWINFYPRPPRGGRLVSHHAALWHCNISIHALREEGDFITASPLRAAWVFLSTPSARRATHKRPDGKSRHRNFYPRPPRGGRRHPVGNQERFREFLSTPSARRATVGTVLYTSA